MLQVEYADNSERESFDTAFGIEVLRNEDIGGFFCLIQHDFGIDLVAKAFVDPGRTVIFLIFLQDRKMLRAVSCVLVLA